MSSALRPCHPASPRLSCLPTCSVSLSRLRTSLRSALPGPQIINFGMSNNFQTVNFDKLQWPAQMLVDYVRVYQRSDGKMGCDPSDRPTANYIANHANAYNNPNLTTWEGAGYTMPVSVCGDGERGAGREQREGRLSGAGWREERGGTRGEKERGGCEQ